MSLSAKLPGAFTRAALAGAIAMACTTHPEPKVERPPPPTSVEPAPVQVLTIRDGGSEEPPAEDAASPVARHIELAVEAGDRDPADRALDPQRQPKKLLSFFEIGPGMRVAELAAGKGYTTELLARAVGPEGRVYGQNTPFILERFAQKPWTERLEKPVMQNTVRLDTELDAPFPEDIEPLDAVLIVLFYHDTVWFETDRAAMNRAVYEALKPGGIYGIVDHRARRGDGVAVAKSLHRIEESVVRREVGAAGFELEASADFLENPDDPRDWNASPSQAGERRGTSDRFVLRFVKPDQKQ